MLAGRRIVTAHTGPLQLINRAAWIGILNIFSLSSGHTAFGNYLPGAVFPYILDHTG